MKKWEKPIIDELSIRLTLGGSGHNHSEGTLASMYNNYFDAHTFINKKESTTGTYPKLDKQIGKIDANNWRDVQVLCGS